MAELPEERLDASTAFTNIGVDFFDTFTVKIGLRIAKRWFCLFACLNLSAVHVEEVTELEKELYLNAILRFIARTSKLCTIISDNWINIVRD